MNALSFVISNGRRILTAVSGRTGKSLWNLSLDQKPINLVNASTVDHGATIIRDRSGPLVAVESGSQWIALDAATGKPRGRPIDLGFDQLRLVGFEPARPMQYAELDGDGTPELLVLGLVEQARTVELTLVAFSIATGEKLWSEPVQNGYSGQGPSLPAEWPAVADSDGDGRAEVIVPFWGPNWLDADQGGVKMLDGATGRTRWARVLWASAKPPTAVFHIITGPDLDHDGTRDFIVVSRFEGRVPLMRGSDGNRLEPRQVFLDALSGKDGRKLWSWHLDLGENASPVLGRPFWWSRGPDGWPFLAFPTGGNIKPAISQVMFPVEQSEPPIVHLLSASSGQECHTIPALSWPSLADLDGDGLDDLWGAVEGNLTALRGEMPEAWARLASINPPATLTATAPATL